MGTVQREYQPAAASLGAWILQTQISRQPLLYQARHETLDRTALLEVLPPESCRDPAIRARFLLRAHVASQRPDLIVSGSELFEHDDQLVSVVEWPRGELLARVAGVLSMADTLDICIDVADALASMHHSGVVHGALRSDAIVVSRAENGRSTAMLLDVGLCLLLGRLPTAEALSAQNSLAPENLRGERVGVTTDVYGLGNLCSELMTRRTGPRGVGLEFKPDVPRRLVGLVRRCLTPDPRERPASVVELASELDQVRSELRRPPALVAAAPTAPTAVSAKPNRVAAEPTARVAPAPPVASGPISPPAPGLVEVDFHRGWFLDDDVPLCEAHRAAIEGYAYAPRRTLRASAMVAATMLATVAVVMFLVFALSLGAGM